MIFSSLKKIPACYRAARLLDHKEISSYYRNISTFHFVVSRRCQYSRSLRCVDNGMAPLLAFAQVPGLLQNGMSDTLTIGFLGAGKMGTALARGFIRAGLVNAGNII